MDTASSLHCSQQKQQEKGLPWYPFGTMMMIHRPYLVFFLDVFWWFVSSMKHVPYVSFYSFLQWGCSSTYTMWCDFSLIYSILCVCICTEVKLPVVFSWYTCRSDFWSISTCCIPLRNLSCLLVWVGETSYLSVWFLTSTEDRIWGLSYFSPVCERSVIS